MNVLSDFIGRVKAQYPDTVDNEELSSCLLLFVIKKRKSKIRSRTEKHQGSQCREIRQEQRRSGITIKLRQQNKGCYTKHPLLLTLEKNLKTQSKIFCFINFYTYFFHSKQGIILHKLMNKKTIIPYCILHVYIFLIRYGKLMQTTSS